MPRRFFWRSSKNLVRSVAVEHKKEPGDQEFRSEQWVPRAVSQVFEFFSRAENLEALTPPWLSFKITRHPAEIRQGSEIEYRLKIHGVAVHWKTRITLWEPGRRFIDSQLSGPYRSWRHLHEFEEHEGGTLMRDIVYYQLHFAPVSTLFLGAWIRRDVSRIFEYRRQKIELLFPKVPAQ